jgi:regulation of enolase protein 1 (concanavalin A-like superfamily)
MRLLRSATNCFVLLATLLTAVLAPGVAQAQAPHFWSEQEVGAVGQRGYWSLGEEGFVVGGSGADIWGTADSFHFVYQRIEADGQMTARVTAINGTQAWTKVGIMIRSDFADPAAAHHFLLASKSKGLAYQRRLTRGGTTAHTSLGTSTAPVWFRIGRAGTTIALSTSADGVNWSAVATAEWPAGPAYVGFAVTSHDNTTLAQGFFDNIALSGNGRTLPEVTVQAPATGDVLMGGQPYTIRWDASDFENDIVRFDIQVATETFGDFHQFSPISGCTNLPADARQCVWQSPGPPDDTVHVVVYATDATGNQNGDDSGRFTILAAGGPLPAGWSNDDIGNAEVAGSASFDGTTFTVQGSGADIWGAADAFHFVHRAMSGDFTLTARVASVPFVHQWTKAGVMVRETLGAGARHASFFATPSKLKGLAFQRRRVENGNSVSTAGPAWAPPVWLKLVRSGPQVWAYYRRGAADAWTFLGTQTLDNLATTVDVGLAVSSHTKDRLATANFTDVTVRK